MNSLPENRDNVARPADRASRRMIRKARQAALATRDISRDDWPFATLVQVACDHAARPLMLLSDLAVHSRNIAADNRVSLLFSPPGSDPVSGSRITVLGRAERSDDAKDRARFLARHHNARDFATFSDFHLYRVDIETVHFIGGFGQIETLAGTEVMLDTGELAPIAEAEAEIVAHMNQDHGEAVQLYAHNIAGRPGLNWLISGVDPEGSDLFRFDSETRIEFPREADSVDAVRQIFVELARHARGSD